MAGTTIKLSDRSLDRQFVGRSKRRKSSKHLSTIRAWQAFSWNHTDPNLVTRSSFADEDEAVRFRVLFRGKEIMIVIFMDVNEKEAFFQTRTKKSPNGLHAQSWEKTSACAHAPKRACDSLRAFMIYVIEYMFIILYYTLRMISRSFVYHKGEDAELQMPLCQGLANIFHVFQNTNAICIYLFVILLFIILRTQLCHHGNEVSDSRRLS